MNGKKDGLPVSYEWIYQYILRDKHAGGDLYLHLRYRKKRKKRYVSNDHRKQIKNRASINLRSEVRTRLGDWEVDTIIGKRHKQAIVSLAESKSRSSLITKVERKTFTP